VASSKLNFTRLNQNLQEISYLLPFQIPPFYSLIVRTLTILEGETASVVAVMFSLVLVVVAIVVAIVVLAATAAIVVVLARVRGEEEGE